MILSCFRVCSLLPCVQLTSWLNCAFVTFPCGILGQMWYLIVSIHDLYHISYFDNEDDSHNIWALFH